MTAVPSAPRPLDVRVEPEREWLRVVLVGELDLATAPMVAETVASLRATGFDAFRIDLRELEFIDSSGLHWLLKMAETDGMRLAVIPGPAAVQRALEISGLIRVLPMER